MFNHVMVGANDIDDSKRFYDAVLGGIGSDPTGAITLGEHYKQKIHAAVDTIPPAT